MSRPRPKTDRILSLIDDIKSLLDDNHSLNEVCNILNIEYGNTYKIIRDYYPEIDVASNKSIITNSRLKSYKKRLILKDDQVDEVKRLYFDERKSLKATGELLGVNAVTVMDFMNRHDLPRRSHSENHKYRLENEEGYRDNLKEWGVKAYEARRRTDTKPERLFKDFLIRNGIRYQEQFRGVGNKHPYDFRIVDTNIIVEIDGYFWHNKPKQKVKDERHTKEANDAGYIVLRICTKDTRGYREILEEYFENNGIKDSCLID